MSTQSVVSSPNCEVMNKFGNGNILSLDPILQWVTPFQRVSRWRTAFKGGKSRWLHLANFNWIQTRAWGRLLYMESPKIGRVRFDAVEPCMRCQDSIALSPIRSKQSPARLLGIMRRASLSAWLLLFLTVARLHPSPAPSFQWVKQINTRLNGFSVDDGGCSYIAGSFGVNSPLDELELGGSSSRVALFVAKLDSQGGLQWARSIRSESALEATQLVNDRSGNCFLIGRWNGGTQEARVDFGNLALTHRADSYFLAKYSGAGQIQWAVETPDHPTSITADLNGHVLVAGSSNTGGAVVRSYDTSGAVAWSLSSTGTFARASDICTDTHGNVYVAGWSYGTNTFAGVTLVGASPFVSKLDGAGKVQWVEPIASENVQVSRVRADGFGNLYLAGSFGGSQGQGTTVMFGSVALTNAGGTDFYLVKLNSARVPVWGFRGGGLGADGISDMTVDGDANIYLAFTLVGSGTVRDRVLNGTSMGFYLGKLTPYGEFDWLSDRNEGATYGRVGLDARRRLYLEGYSYTEAALNGFELPGTRPLAGSPYMGTIVARLDYETLPAFIVTRPAEKTVIEGNPLDLRVSAGGLPPFTYQWRFNDSPIPDATNAAYSVTPVSPSAAGIYSVTVCNSLGCALSPRATVDVESIPALPALDWIAQPRFPVSGISWVSLGGITTDLAGTVYVCGTVRGSSTDFAIYVTAYTHDGATKLLFGDRTSFADYPASIRVDDRGNILVSGFATSGGFGDRTDGFLIKYDPSGKRLWAKISSIAAEVVAVDAAGNAYVVSGDGSALGRVLMRFDPAGNGLKVMDLPDLSRGLAGPVVDLAGNSYLSLEFAGTFARWGRSFQSSGPINSLVAKFSPAGELVWARQIAGPGLGAVESLAVNRSGRLSVYGILAGGSVSLGASTLTNASGVDSFAAQYSAEGDLLWSQPILSPHAYSFPASPQVATDDQGDLFVSVNFLGAITLETISLEEANGNVAIARYSPRGSLDWVRQANAPSSRLAADPGGALFLAVPLQGYVNLAGQSIHANPDPNSTGVWLAKFSPQARMRIAMQGSAGGTMEAHLTISSDYRVPYKVEFSDDFLGWTSLGLATNSTGSVEFLDLPPLGCRLRYYRARDVR